MVNKIKKVGFLTSALILGVGVNIALSSCSFLTSNSTSNSSTSSSSSTKTQLATVTSIEYDYTNNLLTWNKVENANTYNVSINGDIEQVEDEFLYYVLIEEETEFKIQAYDTTNTYIASEWTEPYVVTLTQETSLVAEVNAFAESIVSSNLTLKKVLSVSVEENYLCTNVVYEYSSGTNYLCILHTDFGEEITGLKGVLNMDNARGQTELYSRYEIKDYDTASSFLARTEYSEQIQNLVDQGYSLSFVTNQTYEYSSDGAGLNGLLKATKSGDIRYFDIDIMIGVGRSGSESVRYTTGVRQASVSAIQERSFRELTGDFFEYAQELDEMQSSS